MTDLQGLAAERPGEQTGYGECGAEQSRARPAGGAVEGGGGGGSEAEPRSRRPCMRRWSWRRGAAGTVVRMCWLLTWTAWTAKSSRITPRTSSSSDQATGPIAAHEASRIASAIPVTRFAFPASAQRPARAAPKAPASPAMPNSPICVSLRCHGTPDSGNAMPLHSVPKEANRKNAIRPRLRNTGSTNKPTKARSRFPYRDAPDRTSVGSSRSKQSEARGQDCQDEVDAAPPPYISSSPANAGAEDADHHPRGHDPKVRPRSDGPDSAVV